MKSYIYLGEHDDRRAIPGVGWVKSGTVIPAVNESHEANITAATGPDGAALFREATAAEQASAAAPTEPATPTETPDPEPAGQDDPADLADPASEPTPRPRRGR